MKLWFAADLHVGGALRASSSSFREDWRRALARLRDAIVADAPEDGGWLMLAADIFESRKATDGEIVAWRDFANALADAGVGIAYIQGNHDASDSGGPGLPGAAAEGAVDLSDKSLSFGGVVVHGIGPAPRDRMADLVRNAPPCDVLLVHAGFRHLLPFEEASPLSADMVPKHVGEVVAGHIHVCREDRLLPSGGRVLSPGAMYALRVSEIGEHCVFAAEAGDVHGDWRRIVFHRELRLDASIVCREDVGRTLEDVERKLKSRADGDAPLTLLLNYTQDARPFVDALCADLRGRDDVRAIRWSVADSVSADMQDSSAENLQASAGDGLRTLVEQVDVDAERTLLEAALSAEPTPRVRAWLREHAGEDVEW